MLLDDNRGIGTAVIKSRVVTVLAGLLVAVWGASSQPRILAFVNPPQGSLQLFGGLNPIAWIVSGNLPRPEWPQAIETQPAAIEISRQQAASAVFEPLSSEKEVALGREMAETLERHVQLSTDPIVNDYVEAVGQKIVVNSDARFPFTIKVVKDSTVDAVGLPGGFLYVNTGLIAAADNEAELAGVMAHIIAHVNAAHGAKAVARGEPIHVSPTAVLWFGQSNVSPIPSAFSAFALTEESEADYLGIQYVYKARYQPAALGTFFEELEAKEATKPGTMSSQFVTHPMTNERLKIDKKNIELLGDRGSYILATPEFEKVKLRLAQAQASAFASLFGPSLPSSGPEITPSEAMAGIHGARQIPKNDPTGIWQAESGSKLGSKFSLKLTGPELEVNIVPNSNPKYVEYRVMLKLQEEDINTYKGIGYFVAKMETGKECRFETEWSLTVVEPGRILGSTTSVVADSNTCEVKEKSEVRLDLTRIEP